MYVKIKVLNFLLINIVTVSGCELLARYTNSITFLFNLLAPELFFLILAHPVYKM